METFILQGARGPVAGSVTGNGPCLVLAAGLGATRSLWGDLPRILGRRLTVVSVDNPGVGGSRKAESFTIDGAADAVTEAAHHLGHDQFAVLGVSLGGVIALRSAIRHPDRVSRLVVVSSAARLTSHGRRSIGLLRDLLLYMPPETVGRCLMSLAFAPPFHQRLPGFVDQAAKLYGLDPEDVPGALAQVGSMLAGWDDRPQLRRLATPVLAIAGGRDPIVAAEDTAEIAEVMPGATLITVPDAGHSVLAEAGGELLDRLTTFFSAGQSS